MNASFFFSKHFRKLLNHDSIRETKVFDNLSPLATTCFNMLIKHIKMLWGQGDLVLNVFRRDGGLIQTYDKEFHEHALFFNSWEPERLLFPGGCLRKDQAFSESLRAPLNIFERHSHYTFL